MRMSDWGSYVCASDLETLKDFAVLVIDGQVYNLPDVSKSNIAIDGISVQFDEQSGYAPYSIEIESSGARKPVVSVESVSVSVDCGGRRIFQTKNPINITY